MPAIRVKWEAGEAGLNLAVCGILRLDTGQWWNGTSWGAPPVISTNGMPPKVFLLLPLAGSGLLSGQYWGSYPTDTTGFGPVSATVQAYVFNLQSQKFEGAATAVLIGGDDGPVAPGAPVPAPPVVIPPMPTKLTINLPAQTITLPAQQVTGSLG